VCRKSLNFSIKQYSNNLEIMGLIAMPLKSSHAVFPFVSVFQILSVSGQK